MSYGGLATSRRLPFHFHAHGGVGRLALTDLTVGPIGIDKLELEVTELGTDPGAAAAERFQRRRTRLRGLAMRITQPSLDARVVQIARQLSGTGLTQLAARLDDGYVSVRARAADGLAAADLSFHVELVDAGTQLRAMASAIRIHGHLPTPGPVIADRVLVALLGAGDASATGERPVARGLCDVEVDLVGTLLWQVLPPSGWRLPAVTEIELTHIRVARGAIEIAYGPAGTRIGELGVRQRTHQLAAAHDLMHSVDQQLHGGHFEDAMRGYRALLASSGPDQPLLLERILVLAAARPAWFFDGLELARQALGRWPTFAAAHAALASITLAQGDARQAAKHLEQVARLASAEADDDQAALAALAAARLLRVLDARAATVLYQLAIEHDPASAEAADSLADRLADEQRWPELVRLVRARAGITSDAARTVQLHLRLADVFVHQLGDPAGARHELAAARALAPDDPAIHEMTAQLLAASDPAAAFTAWREVARLAELRGDHRTCARAWARLGDLHAAPGWRDPAAGSAPAEDAWRRALELDPLQVDALVGLASAAAERNDHAIAAALYERLRGLGLAQSVAARHELALARSLIALGRADDARASLRRAALAGGELAAEAHAMLAELAELTGDRDRAAIELDTAITALFELAAEHPDAERLSGRAAALAAARAALLDRAGHPAAAAADWQRAHALAGGAAPAIARTASRTMLARAGDAPGAELRWISAVLATDPPAAERAELLVRRAEAQRRERPPDLAAASADLRAAIALTDEPDEVTSATRRRAFELLAELFAERGDLRARAAALAALPALVADWHERLAREATAAAAWLEANDPAAALIHAARAHAQLAAQPPGTTVAPSLLREVQTTLGEAAWQQRAWPDAIAAYRRLLDPGAAEPSQLATYRYRLAVAADRAGDHATALAALRPLFDDPSAARGLVPELRAQVLRLFAELAERAGELIDAATALEAFAAIGDGSATARADAVYRAGELFRRADRGDDSIRSLETALRISDAHLPALDALEAAWRERGDLERVAVILGRKVAATARHPARQKPLLSRLGDLQDQLGRPDVAQATHQRALEIDPIWRPSLRYVTLGLRDSGQVVAAAGGLAQLAGELHGDHGVDLSIVTRERQIAAEALSELVAKLDDAQLDAVREVVRPALDRAALDNASVAAGLARLRGDPGPPGPGSPRSEDTTQSGHGAIASAQALRDAAARERLAGKLDAAFATLETADQLHPGDPDVLRELVDLATQIHDYPAATRHLTALAHRLTAGRRGDALLELADLYYDQLNDAVRGRETMSRAADAFGSGSRRDATLRMLATEAATHLAWDVAVEAIVSIAVEKRSHADFINLATALTRAGRDADALAVIEAATAAQRFDDQGELLRQLQHEIQRKTDLVRALEERALGAAPEEAAALLDEAQQLRLAIGQPGAQPLRDTAVPSDTPKADTAPWPARTKTRPGLPSRPVAPAKPSRPPPLVDPAAEPSSGVPVAAAEPPGPPAIAAAPAAGPAPSETGGVDLRQTLQPSGDDEADLRQTLQPSGDDDRAEPRQTVRPPLADTAAATAPPIDPPRAPASGADPDPLRATIEPTGDDERADLRTDFDLSEGTDRVAATRPAPPDREPPRTAVHWPDEDIRDEVSAAIAASAADDRAPPTWLDDDIRDAIAAVIDASAGGAPLAPPDAAARGSEGGIGDDASAAIGKADAGPAEPPRATPPADRDRATAAAALGAQPAAAPSGNADRTSPADAATPTGVAPSRPPQDLRIPDPAAATGSPPRSLRIPAPGAAAANGAAGEPLRPIAPTAGTTEPRAMTRRGPHTTVIPLAPSPGAPVAAVAPPGAAAPPPDPYSAAAAAEDDLAVPIAGIDRTVIGRPVSPGPLERHAPRPRERFSSPTLGRIKLIPGAVTRPGLGALQGADDDEDAGDDDDSSGGWQSVSNPALTSSRALAPPPPPPAEPSVTITGTAEETALALLLAAASADRDRLFAARRADPDDPSMLLALLAHLGDREPEVRRELLDEAVRTSHGRALAIALHELAVAAREARDPARAVALWTRAYQADPGYPPVWMPLADALAAADDTDTARELYEAVAGSDDYDAGRRGFAAGRAEALGRDDSIVSGEIPRTDPPPAAQPAPPAATPPPSTSETGDTSGTSETSDLDEAKQLAEGEDWPGAIDAAERAAAARPNDAEILEVVERIYFASGNVTKASEAIARQLELADDPARKATLWRRRARMYRDALGRDAEAYRCLKEAHDCSPADPEIAYQLRTAAMVRGEWTLAAQLLYREIAAAATPRDRGALHLELALIYEERLDDPAQAQANYEQALAFDPTIPAVKSPLARRYESIGRPLDAARLYEEAAATARAADRGALLEAAARCRATAIDVAEPDLATQLDRAEAAGDLDAALDLAYRLWRAEPGHPAAFRVLANLHRTSGDLSALTELTRVRASQAEVAEDRATAWLEVARLAEEVGALDQAARAYDLALIEDPGHVSALDARGALAFRLADFATADLIYRDLGTGESVLGDDELALRRSIIAEQLGRDSESLQLAQIAADLAPGRRDVMTRVQELATRIGELSIALDAARHVIELVPLDEDEAQLGAHFALVELLREAGQLDEAVTHLEKILLDHPVHAGAIEALAQVHAARGDWPAATRYLYQLVPLAPSPIHRAERLYQLGEAVLVHLGDVDRADDVFLRASDLDPGHVPTLRRLLDVYWRSDDPAGIVEVATELAEKDALISNATPDAALGHALIAAALIGDTQLAQLVHAALGDAAPRLLANALGELAGRTGRLQLGSASTAITDLARRGLVDLAKLRAAAAGTPAANSL